MVYLVQPIVGNNATPKVVNINQKILPQGNGTFIKSGLGDIIHGLVVLFYQLGEVDLLYLQQNVLKCTEQMPGISNVVAFARQQPSQKKGKVVPDHFDLVR